ncbi:MAG: RagB/SusD family nutrient uptake outer membrane protein [Saprospiraceae bacterium]
MTFKNKFLVGLALSAGVFMTSCEIEPVGNPNAPSIESYENGATLSELNLLATGTEAVLRNDLAFYYNTVDIVGRDYYNLDGSDPRYTSELLGVGPLDDNGFLTTRAFSAGYRAIRTAQILLNAVPNTVASLSAAQVAGYNGFANTLIAYNQLLLLNRQFENGIRIDVSDPDNLGAFVGYSEALASIASRLDQADSDLSGAEFPFSLSGGFASVGQDAAGFRQFNRAIAARVALYQSGTNNSKALGVLGDSFFSLDGDLTTGAYHTFSPSGNDMPNPLFNVPGVNNTMAHPGWVEDAEAGDTRLSKVTEQAAAVSLDGLSSPYLVTLYASNASQVPIITNEELVLIYAEANIGGDNAEAVNAINVIRTAAGLAEYSGDTSDSALLDEVLQQRRYSLYGQGHRWLDLRRTGNLDRIDILRDGASVHVQFPTPVAEDGE